MHLLPVFLSGFCSGIAAVGYFSVMGDFLQECVAVFCVVHFAAIVFHSIAYYQIVHLQYKIVAGNLREHIRCYGDCWCFVLYDGFGCDVLVVNNCVASELYVVQLYLCFVCQQRLRVAFFVYQVVDKMLPYPFFRCKCHVAAPQYVENAFFVVLDNYSGFVWREIQCLHCVWL